MPLLSLFSRKKSSLKGSTVAYSASTISLNDEDYVSVAATSPRSDSLPASSSSAPLHSRRPNEHAKAYQVPCLEPPPRQSSRFQAISDDHDPSRSTRSLPSHPEAEHRSLQGLILPRRPITTSPLSTPPKKSLFNWTSNKNRNKTSPLAKAKPDVEDSSFNLKSFRHVVPNLPGVASSSGRQSPSPSPTFPPVPTSTLPPQPAPFQVTSRRPRGNSTTQLELASSAALSASMSTSTTSTATVTQQRIPAGVFRQAARRSATSLILSDSPRLSPVRNSLDDRSPPSLALQYSPPLASSSTSSLPPRPPRPPAPSASSSSVYSQPNTQRTMSSSPNISASNALSTRNPPFPPKVLKQAQQTTNAFGSSSESESSEDEDEEDSDSEDDGTGIPRISRRRTIRQGSVTQNINEQGTEQSQTRTSNLALPRFPSQPNQPTGTRTSTRISSVTTDDMPRPSSSLSVYGSGTRPRASLSVGALTPSARETRASMVLAANTRISNYNIQTTPKPGDKRLARSDDSDTPESDASGSDSEEDAPLSSLLLPQRPGTSLSSQSTSTVAGSRKPLVDLSAPSTLTGRPVAGPPPISREDDSRPKPKVNVDTGVKWKGTPTLTPQVKRNPQVELTRHSKVPSQSSSGGSQGTSIRTPTGNETSSTPSRNDKSPRYSSFARGGTRMNSLGSNVPSVSPPARPFVRRDSPVSSTGDSSSGRAPYTPRDGSDTRSAYSRPPSAISTGKERSTSYGRTSVTFEDDKDVTIKGKGKGKGKGKEREPSEEAKRKERRRTEARDAIELGNVVNGPPPVDPDEVDSNFAGMGVQGGWPQVGMQMPMSMQVPMSGPAMFNMGGMGLQPPAFGFPSPLPPTDPAFIAAHQKAMAIAKQTFQIAVAQQALAVANDEWERNSTMTAFAPSTSAAPWGYGMGMQQTVFPSAARSMYAGSVNGGAWGGTRSVYGEAFGPPNAGGRMSTYSQGMPDLPATTAAQRPVRPRTKTAPSAASPMNVPTARVPPSSFRAPGR